MTTISLIDQQYKKLFSELNLPDHALDPFEELMYVWGLERQLTGFAAANGLPTFAFYETVAAANHDLHKLLALKLLSTTSTIFDEKVIRLFYQPRKVSILSWIIRLISERNLLTCVDLLEPLLTHKTSDIRQQAIAARALLLGQQLWQADFKHTKDDDPRIRLEAYGRLATHEQGVPLYVWQRAYQETYVDIRQIAIKQLSQFPCDYVDALMLEAIKDKDFTIAKVAREYLKRNPDQYFDHLSKLLPESCAQTAIFSLDVICRSKKRNILPLLLQTYETAKSNDLHKKVVVELQKIKSNDATRFFISRGELKLVKSRNLSEFFPELVQLAVDGNNEALELIVKNAKGASREILLSIFDNVKSCNAARYSALRAYFDLRGEANDKILKFLSEEMAGSGNNFYKALDIVRDYKLLQLADTLNVVASTCEDQKKLRYIKKMFDELGLDHSAIEVEEKPLKAILESGNDKEILTVLSHIDRNRLGDHSEQLLRLMYRDDSKLRALARELMCLLDSEQVKRKLKSQLELCGADRRCIALEHARAIGVDEYLLLVQPLVYDDNLKVSESAVMALEKSQDDSVNLERTRRNIERHREIKADPKSLDAMPESVLLDMIHDPYCVSGRAAAKTLVSKGVLSIRDPDFAYLLILAQDHDRLYGCPPIHVATALDRLIRYPYTLYYWRAFEFLRNKNFDIQKICRDFLSHGYRRQQECAASALKSVEMLDYRALLEVGLRYLHALELVLNVLSEHAKQAQAQDLKFLYDAHLEAFGDLTEENDGIVYRRARSGMISLLVFRQKIGCKYFLSDSIAYVEKHRSIHGWTDSVILNAIGNVDSNEALFYLVSLLRTSEVQKAAYAIRNRLHQLQNPGDKLIVALFSKQADKMGAIKKELKTVTPEEFNILQEASREASLKETFMDMCKVIGSVFYTHALNSSTKICPGGVETFCNFFSQKAYKEADDFLIYHLENSFHNVQKRVYCIRGLGKTRCQRALPLIEAQLRSDDVVELRAVIEALARIGNRETLEKLKNVRPKLRKNLIDVCDKSIHKLDRELEVS